MSALTSKVQTATMREYAANAIVAASTQPDYDMDELLYEIDAARDRLDERQAKSGGESTWGEKDWVEAAMENSEVLGADDEPLVREVIYAHNAIGDDPGFWREVEERIRVKWKERQIGKPLPPGGPPPVRTRI